MAHVVKTKVGNKIRISPVQNGQASDARGSWKSNRTKSGEDYQNAKGGEMVRFIENGQLTTMLWVDV